MIKQLNATHKNLCHSGSATYKTFLKARKNYYERLALPSDTSYSSKLIQSSWIARLLKADSSPNSFSSNQEQCKMVESEQIQALQK